MRIKLTLKGKKSAGLLETLPGRFDIEPSQEVQSNITQ